MDQIEGSETSEIDVAFALGRITDE